MRVIAGTHRSRALKAPRGAKTRPTTDRVREALFAILTSLGVFDDPPRVLDLYAGSGALGIEALSRGAVSAVLVEEDRAALAVIRENLRSLELEGQARVVASRVERIVGRPSPAIEGPFELVFLDPPYEQVRTPGFLTLLTAATRLVTPAGVLVLEHSSSDPPPSVADFAADSRRYGDTAVSVYRSVDCDPVTPSAGHSG